MKRILAAITFSVLLVASSLGSQPKNSEAKDSASFVLHVDFQKLKKSKTGSTLNETFWKIPYIAKQLKTLPRSLAFLRDIELQALTVYQVSEKDGDSPVLEIQARFEAGQLTDLLTHARGYAKVQYQGHDIHHWMTDFEKLGNQWMGQPNSKSQDEQAQDAVYLSIPESGRVVIATSLADLVKSLERNAPAATLLDRSRIASQLGEGENLVTYQVEVESGVFPGSMVAVLREDATGRVVVQTATKARNDAERMQAQLVNQTFNNPTLLLQMLGGEVQPAGDADSELNASATVERTVESNDPDDQANNEMMIGFKMDSLDLDAKNLRGVVDHVMKNCVKSEFAEDTLRVSAGVFVAPCKITNTPKDSEEGIAMGLTRNRLMIEFHVFTSAEKRDEAIRAVRTASETEVDGGIRR